MKKRLLMAVKNLLLRGVRRINVMEPLPISPHRTASTRKLTDEEIELLRQYFLRIGRAREKELLAKFDNNIGDVGIGDTFTLTYTIKIECSKALLDLMLVMGQNSKEEAK